MKSSKEALDNLHRCALCYQSENKNEWIKHCRKVRDIVDKDLDLLEIIKKYIYFSPKSHCIRMREIRKSTRNFDYEELKDVFKK